MSTTRKRVRSAWTAAIAGAAALLLAVGGATSAGAAPGDGGPLILPGEGEADITGTVTIHKLEQGTDPGAPANGLRNDVLDSNDGIAGVTFTATQITSVTSGGEEYPLDLTTNDGWLNASDLVRSSDGSWTFREAPATVTTGVSPSRNTGTDTYNDAFFEELPVGLYLFEETAAPAGVTKSAPWVMTVPLTHPTELDSWLYDIHVYPKNSISAIGKTVNDEGATDVGDAISWTITGDIPLTANPDFDPVAPVSGTNLKFFAPTAYVIKDDLDDRLKPAATNPVVVTLEGTDVTLIPTDYSVEWDDAVTPQGANLTITFAQAGLDKLGLAVSTAEDPADVKVKVVLTTTIETLKAPSDDAGTIGDGIINNQAQLFPNESSVVSNTPVLSPEPVSKWGDILIKKTDATNGKTLLPGAEFSVYTTETNALAGNDPVVIDGESTFVTNDDGVVRISGLRYSDWANGKPLDNDKDPNWQYYWIVETKAPEGYELLAEPIRVAVTEAQQDVELATVIENAPSNGGFELPLTGAAGTWMFSLGGILLIGGGLLLALRRKGTAADSTVA